MRGRRRSTAGWALSIYFAILGAAFGIAAIVGAATANWPLLGFGVCGAGFFGWIAWMLSPPSVRRANPARVERQRDFLNRLLLRLHITWAVDPRWRERYEQRP